jgi:hypothetical protein
MYTDSPTLSRSKKQKIAEPAAGCMCTIGDHNYYETNKCTATPTFMCKKCHTIRCKECDDKEKVFGRCGCILLTKRCKSCWYTKRNNDDEVDDDPEVYIRQRLFYLFSYHHKLNTRERVEFKEWTQGAIDRETNFIKDALAFKCQDLKATLEKLILVCVEARQMVLGKDYKTIDYIIANPHMISRHWHSFFESKHYVHNSPETNGLCDEHFKKYFQDLWITNSGFPGIPDLKDHPDEGNLAIPAAQPACLYLHEIKR